MKAYLKKTMVQMVRTNKLLVMAIIFIGFAIMTPIMVKFLPEILSAQMGDIDLSGYIKTSTSEAMRNYTKNLYQIILLVIVYLAATSAVYEINMRMVFPLTAGAKKANVVLSNTVIYTLAALIMAILSVLIVYFYSMAIMENDIENIRIIIKSACLYGVFFFFIISLSQALGYLLRNSVFALIGTLFIVYISGPLFGLMGKVHFFPTYLLAESDLLTKTFSAEAIYSIVIALAGGVILNILGIILFSKKDITKVSI